MVLCSFIEPVFDLNEMFPCAILCFFLKKNVCGYHMVLCSFIEPVFD
ncbi:hypothetical protein ANCCAN_21081 [Ancylostoma caninum]|uniref:Uncharacterized protein n=1 Tax=Ancylostoma caninum TaxID=29170 RepID=A0A368FSA6_ANCCA|nr:hypothetical protein ANCCAN_21081 [Ancylostoma caninum]